MASELLEALHEAMDLNRSSRNIFESLSYALISSRSPDTFQEEQVEEMTSAWVNFLEYIRENANEISEQIEEETN